MSAVGATLDGSGPPANAATAATLPELLDVATGATLNPDDPESQRFISGISAPAAAHLPVTNWDRYDLLRLLGQGGMGAVYEARDRKLGRIVALKFIRGNDEQMSVRFLQEARTQSKIDHPGICKVYEVGTVDGKPYIAMQFVDGVSLAQLATRLSLNEKVAIMRDTAVALHAAHELGIIHRDIKPANIMVETRPDGYRPIVMDFGLAREATENRGLTESGTVMGTPAFMSPEQARGEVRLLERRSDVYSLGATLFELIAGEPPFNDESVVNVLLKVLTQEAPALSTKVPDLPKALDIITSKYPQQRYQTAAALAVDLSRFLEQKQIVGRKVSLRSRLLWKAKTNRPLAAAVLGFLLTVLGFTGWGVRTYVQNLRRERAAKRQAELAQRLGQEMKDMEWLLRTARGMPLHDLTREKKSYVLDGRRFETGRFTAMPGAVAICSNEDQSTPTALHEFGHAASDVRTSIGDLYDDGGRGRVLINKRFRNLATDAVPPSFCVYEGKTFATAPDRWPNKGYQRFTSYHPARAAPEFPNIMDRHQVLGKRACRFDLMTAKWFADRLDFKTAR